MKQAELLRDVAEYVSTLTGKDYRVNYAPMRNLSEQEPSEYRAVSPGSMRKEAVTRGVAPVTYQEVRIAVFKPFGLIDAESIAEVQDELELILDSMMSRATPLRFTSDDGTVEGTVKAGECQPGFDSGVNLAELEQHQPMLIGSVSVMFLLG